MWSDFYDTILAANPAHEPPVPPDCPFYVLIEATGAAQASDDERFQESLGEAMEAGLLSDAAIAGSGAQRDAFWAIRDDIESLLKAVAPHIAFDVSLPISHVDEYVRNVKARLRARWPRQFRCVTFGHLGDSNIHLVLTTGSSRADERRTAMEIVYEELQPYGGSISAEHGIGAEKRPYLHLSRSDTELALMQTLKKALDPLGILNPGKVLDRA
jgi:FAD/FMN-containing dehydrogenase